MIPQVDWDPQSYGFMFGLFEYMPTCPHCRKCFDSGLITPVHELMHCLGFVHEHTRPDRDNFVAVNTDNIVAGAEKNFEKRKQGYSDFFDEGSVNAEHSPYDVSSVLHYGPKDFSANGTEVITFLHGLPDETWPESAPEDPLSLIDQVISC